MPGKAMGITLRRKLELAAAETVAAALAGSPSARYAAIPGERGHEKIRPCAVVGVPEIQAIETTASPMRGRIVVAVETDAADDTSADAHEAACARIEQHFAAAVLAERLADRGGHLYGVYRAAQRYLMNGADRLYITELEWRADIDGR